MPRRGGGVLRRYLANEAPESKGHCLHRLHAQNWGMNVEIRPLLPEELAPLAQFYHAVWHETHGPLQDARVAQSRPVRFFEERLNRWRETTIVAFMDSVPIGFASWEGLVLEALYVSPQSRSSGLGTKLLAMAEANMCLGNSSRLSLDCVCANTAGRAFYERNGWRVEKTVEHADATEASIFTPHWLMVK